mmetsp:Transcript_7956/g.16582  ORF Transcript_7956/g.16582 Transcript_7956/m.16582 type:complete len:299 (+) Transcript_7956:97-993(+)
MSRSSRSVSADGSTPTMFALRATTSAAASSSTNLFESPLKVVSTPFPCRLANSWSMLSTLYAWSILVEILSTPFTGRSARAASSTTGGAPPPLCEGGGAAPLNAGGLTPPLGRQGGKLVKALVPDRLLDLDGGVGAEPEAALQVEELCRSDDSKGTLLEQLVGRDPAVGQGAPAPVLSTHPLFHDRGDEAKVGGDQPVFGGGVVTDVPAQRRGGGGVCTFRPLLPGGGRPSSRARASWMRVSSVPRRIRQERRPSSAGQSRPGPPPPTAGALPVVTHGRSWRWHATPCQQVRHNEDDG